MAKQELTKRLLADTLKKLCQTRPLDKISVREIAEAANSNRQTFYYHFKDKQSLICWIFDTDIAGVTDKNNNNTILDDIVEYFYSEREFYKAALASSVQNSLREHIFSLVRDRVLAQINEYADDTFLSAKETGVIASFFSHAAVGLLAEWAQSGMKPIFDDLSAEFWSITDNCLSYIVHQYAKHM
ncbi:TetR/AcrR family transcriptional regulator C-terminal domain-containing protein [Oscillospiraceae bacterium OttesenSCG-928-G22]|nr:TetR/AcrR family transcriptional regulator C-terminal domain-containing protein [Oscillospiraceae bacterium OttesenSCG-928-G22]